MKATRNVTRVNSVNHDYLNVVFTTDFARQVFTSKLSLYNLTKDYRQKLYLPFSLCGTQNAVICKPFDLKQTIWSTNFEAFCFRMFSCSAIISTPMNCAWILRLFTDFGVKSTMDLYAKYRYCLPSILLRNIWPYIGERLTNWARYCYSYCRLLSFDFLLSNQAT